MHARLSAEKKDDRNLAHVRTMRPCALCLALWRKCTASDVIEGRIACGWCRDAHIVPRARCRIHARRSSVPNRLFGGIFFLSFFQPNQRRDVPVCVYIDHRALPCTVMSRASMTSYRPSQRREQQPMLSFVMLSVAGATMGRHLLILAPDTQHRPTEVNVEL